MRKLNSILFVAIFFLLIYLCLPYIVKAQEGSCFVLHEVNIGTVNLLKVPCPESRDSPIRQRLLDILVDLPEDGSTFYIDTIARRWSNDSLHWSLLNAVNYVRSVSPPTDEVKNYSGEEIKSWVVNYLLANDRPFPLNNRNIRVFAQQFEPSTYKLIHDVLRNACYEIEACNNND